MNFLIPTVFFWPKISKVASTSIAFFSSPTFLLLARSCSPFLLLRWNFFGLKDLLFDSISLKVLQISLGWFSKIRLDIYVWLDFLKHGYKIFLIYLSTEYFGGGSFFFIVTFYLFNFYQIFTEHTAVDTVLWVSHWLLTSPPPLRDQKKNALLTFHNSLCRSALSKVFWKASLGLMKEQVSRLAKSAVSNIFWHFVSEFGCTGERLILGLGGKDWILRALFFEATSLWPYK